MRKLFALGAFVYTLSCSTGPAMASGSEGGGSAETGDMQAYNMGKSVYARKLACGSCPLAGKGLDATLAHDLLTGKGTVTMSEAETKALTEYLAVLSDDESNALKAYLQLRFNP